MFIFMTFPLTHHQSVADILFHLFNINVFCNGLNIVRMLCACVECVCVSMRNYHYFRSDDFSFFSANTRYLRTERGKTARIKETEGKKSSSVRLTGWSFKQKIINKQFAHWRRRHQKWGAEYFSHLVARLHSCLAWSTCEVWVRVTRASDAKDASVERQRGGN